MKFTYVFLCMFCWQCTFAQVGVDFGEVMVDNVNINEIEDLELIMIDEDGGLFKSGVEIRVDYGERGKIKYGRKSRDRGDNMKFNTLMSAFNFLENNGWTFVETFSRINGASGNTNQNNTYMFRRKRGQMGDK